MTNLLSVREAADFLGLKPVTIYKYINSRSIPFIKIGRRVLFEPEDLESWLKDKKIPVIGG